MGGTEDSEGFEAGWKDFEFAQNSKVQEVGNTS
jgi:hypothetical protein